MTLVQTLGEEYSSRKNRSKIDTLEEGMRFKSYKALCEFLGVFPIPDGNSKPAHLKELQRYVNLISVDKSNAYIIGEIYDKPLEVDDLEGFRILLRDLICDLLIKDYKTTGEPLYRTTFSGLYYDLGFTNKKFCKYRDDSDLVAYFFEMTEGNPVAYLFFQETCQKIRAYIDYALDWLSKRSLLSYRMTYMVASDEKRSKEYFLADPFQEALIVEAQNYALGELKLKKPGDLFYSRDWSKYYSLIEEYLSQKTNEALDREEETNHIYFEKFFKIYEIDSSQLMEKAKDRLPQLERDPRKSFELNQRFVKSIKKNTKKQYKEMELFQNGKNPGLGWYKRKIAARFLSSFKKDRAALIKYTLELDFRNRIIISADREKLLTQGFNEEYAGKMMARAQAEAERMIIYPGIDRKESKTEFTL